MRKMSNILIYAETIANNYIRMRPVRRASNEQDDRSGGDEPCSDRAQSPQIEGWKALAEAKMVQIQANG